MIEDAVDPLIDAFHAGVDEETGLAIIKILSMIGGFEVRIFLDNLVIHGTRFKSWQDAAKTGLQQYD